MLIQEDYIHSIPDLSSIEPDVSGKQSNLSGKTDKHIKTANLKKGSIPYPEYREFCYLI
jgi:hypothetical protein